MIATGFDAGQRQPMAAGFYDTVRFEPEASIGYQVRRLHLAVSAALEPILSEEGIAHGQWLVLMSLYHGRADTCAQVARDLGHDPGAMTRLIDGLEHRDLVIRIRRREDRRQVRLALTEIGRSAVARSERRVADAWNQWLAGWSPDAVVGLLSSLRSLRDTIEPVSKAP